MSHRFHRVPTTADLLPLAGIEDGILRLDDGGCRAVLALGTVNLALASAAEQEALLAGYRAFLNGLRFPVQLLVRVEPADIERYLAGLRQPVDGGVMLVRLALDHETFVRRLARERVLLDRRCYLVVPDTDADAGPARALPRRHPWPWRRPTPTAATARPAPAVAALLTARCAALGVALAALGVPARRLGTAELVALWASLLVPRRARAFTAAGPPGPIARIRPLPARAGEEGASPISGVRGSRISDAWPDATRTNRPSV